MSKTFTATDTARRPSCSNGRPGTLYSRRHRATCKRLQQAGIRRHSCMQPALRIRHLPLQGGIAQRRRRALPQLERELLGGGEWGAAWVVGEVVPKTAALAAPQSRPGQFCSVGLSTRVRGTEDRLKTADFLPRECSCRLPVLTRPSGQLSDLEAFMQPRGSSYDYC